MYISEAMFEMYEQEYKSKNIFILYLINKSAFYCIYYYEKVAIKKNSSINQNKTNFKDLKFPFEFKTWPLYIAYI